MTITGGGGVPIRYFTLVSGGTLSPIIPSSLEEAKSFFAGLSPSPVPGRPPVLKLLKLKMRRCHGCHGLNDESHEAIPMGAEKCPLPHSSLCEGGIVGGKDSKGRDWRGCQMGYLGPSGVSEPDDDDSDDHGSDDEEQSQVSKSRFKFPPITSSQPNTNTSSTSTAAMSSLNTVMTTASSSFSSGSIPAATQSSLTDELAALEKLKLERSMLEEQARLMLQQKESAERLEIQRQLKAERDRIEHLRQQSGAASIESETQDVLRNNQSQEILNSGFHSVYEGPNIKQIRKVKGLKVRVEDTVDLVRSDIPSLSRRPSAKNNQKPTVLPGLNEQQGRKKKASSRVNKIEDEFEQFKAWKKSRSNRKQPSDSESDDSPPRAQSKRHVQATDLDPLTDSDDSDEDVEEEMVLVHRRDKNGYKYRVWEPVKHNTQQYVWEKDSSTGREYKRTVTNSSDRHSRPIPAKSSAKPSGSVSAMPGLVDHRVVSVTPASGHNQGRRSPPVRKTQAQDRFPGIYPLNEKQGNIDDKKSPTIIDWARNCPVTYAEKLKYEEINLPVYVWACVSEILSSRTGLTPDMPQGELEARLQHLLCVLQVALIHSEKTDYNSTGWNIASIYAKRIQQKLDRGLDSWEGFARFGHDPHPSEMFAAKTEADSKQPKKKKEEVKLKSEKKMCTTWNNCEVERKCQYLVDNPTATRCFRRHECSYCIEKNLGNFHHQRRFCPKKRAAGDD